MSRSADLVCVVCPAAGSDKFPEITLPAAIVDSVYQGDPDGLPVIRDIPYMLLVVTKQPRRFTVPRGQSVLTVYDNVLADSCIIDTTVTFIC